MPKLNEGPEHGPRPGYLVASDLRRERLVEALHGSVRLDRRRKPAVNETTVTRCRSVSSGSRSAYPRSTSVSTS